MGLSSRKKGLRQEGFQYITVLKAISSKKESLEQACRLEQFQSNSDKLKYNITRSFGYDPMNLMIDDEEEAYRDNTTL